MNKPIHPAVAEHVMQENVRLRELLREAQPYVTARAVGPMATNNLLKEIRAALSQQSEPLYVTHRPLIRNAINLLGMRRPVAPDVQRVIDDLEAMLGGQSAPAGAPSEEWLQVATLAEPAPAQDERNNWPAASKEDAANGWILDYGFVERVTEIAASRTEYTTSMEATEQVLLAACEFLGAARPAQTEQQPAAVVDANDEGMWADILPGVTVKVGQQLYAAPVVPSGMATVSLEPTLAMRDAFCSLWIPGFANDDMATRCWKDMVAAALAAQGGE